MNEDKTITERDEQEKILTPLQAIRARCLDCCCFSAHEVELCPCTKCALYPYRLGKHPYIKKREYTEEQRSAMRERMLKVRSQLQNAD